MIFAPRFQASTKSCITVLRAVFSDVASDERDTLDFVPVDRLVSANGEAERECARLIARAESTARTMALQHWVCPMPGRSSR